MFESFRPIEDAPPDIVRFERLWLFGLVLATVNVILLFEYMRGQYSSNVTAVADILIIGISALLMVYTTRRRSNLARWMLAIPWNILVVAYYVLNLPAILNEQFLAVLVVIRLVLIAVATHWLFTPASRAWFRSWPLAEGGESERDDQS